MPLLSLFAILLIVSCSQDSIVKKSSQQEKVIPVFSTFNENFPYLAKNIDYNYLQKVGDSKKSSGASNPEAFAAPVIKDGVVLGRYVGLANGKNAMYIDYSDYKNSITIYDVNNPENYKTLPTRLNEETGVYEVIQSTKGFCCGAACGFGTVAIMATDGSLPFMDIIAVGFANSCLANCAS